MATTDFTPGPWYVRDLTAKSLRALGWTGPSIDRILITNKSGPEIIRDQGEDCVIARIQFDQRTEELGESNLADAQLIAAAPTMYERLALLVDVLSRVPVTRTNDRLWGAYTGAVGVLAQVQREQVSA